MKSILAAASIAVLLSATPILAQTDEPAPEPVMNVLAAQERAELQNRYRNAETQDERNRVRAEIENRVRSQEMLNRELAPAYRNQLSAQEQRQIRQQLQNADGDFARNAVMNQAQSMAQNRIRERTRNTEQAQVQNRFQTSMGGKNPNAPRWGSPENRGGNSGSPSAASSGAPWGKPSGGSGNGGRR